MRIARQTTVRQVDTARLILSYSALDTRTYCGIGGVLTHTTRFARRGLMTAYILVLPHATVAARVAVHVLSHTTGRNPRAESCSARAAGHFGHRVVGVACFALSIITVEVAANDVLLLLVH